MGQSRAIPYPIMVAVRSIYNMLIKSISCNQQEKFPSLEFRIFSGVGVESTHFMTKTEKFDATSGIPDYLPQNSFTEVR